MKLRVSHFASPQWKGLIMFLFCCFSLPLYAITPTYWKTTQQVPVVFYQTHAVPMATIHVAFKAGSAFDGSQWGLAALTASMLDEGNDGITAGDLANKLADTGAIYAQATNRDMADFSLTTLTTPAAFQSAIQQFVRILTRPDFPASHVEHQKMQQLAGIRNENESANQVALLAFFKTLYADHPYGHRILGEPDTLKNITRDDIQAFYHRYYVPENAVIVIVGAVSPKQAKILANQLISALPHGRSAPAIPTASAITASQSIHMPFDASQTAICIGQLGITHHSPYYFPLIVGNEILGGGSLVSQLAILVREKRGLTYHIGSEFLPMPGTGPFLINLSTQHQQATEAQTLAQSVLTHFVTAGPMSAELDDAKRYLTGSFPLALSSNIEIANVLLRLVFYHLPPDFLDKYVAQIQAVTPADIRAAFQATLNPDKMIHISVGP